MKKKHGSATKVRNGFAFKESNGSVAKKSTVFFDPMAVTWSTKYNDQISKVWNYLPESLAKLAVSVSIFMLGVSINGDWLNIWVHLAKQLGYYQTNSTSSIRWDDLSLENLKLKNVWTFWMYSCLVSYSIYFVIGGFINWYYYVRQRDRAEEWKCQPHKWLSPELERDEIMWGSITLFCNASASGLLSCYISNGGYSTVYYNVSERGWIWFLLQFPLIFIYQDYFTYWLHRIYHTPFLYKHFHKLHHKYKQPTAFSVTAIHPVEALHIQLCLIAPIFLLPIHWLPFYTASFYAYYHGIIDHSGVNFKSYWWQPWQPDAIFHDNHHQYFHVNFAFNISYWDKLHGTYRRKDRVYNENTFYGGGKSMNSATKDELNADIEERNLENPLAYREEAMPFKLSQKDVKNLKKKK